MSDWQFSEPKKSYYYSRRFEHLALAQQFTESVCRLAAGLGQASFFISQKQTSVTVGVGQKQSEQFRQALVDLVASQETNGADQTRDSLEPLQLYCDGASRGNPGPAAAGYVVVNHLDQPVCQGGDFLGSATNNIAEYQSLKLGLERVLSLGARAVTVFMDSQLVVRQIKGQYKVKNQALKQLYQQIRVLIDQFEASGFAIDHIPRQANRKADAIANQFLDNHSPKADQPDQA